MNSRKIAVFAAWSVWMFAWMVLPASGQEQGPVSDQPSGPPAQSVQQNPQGQPEQPVDPQAQDKLKQVGQAYRDLQSLKVKGTVQLNIDAAGMTEEQKGQFIASYQAPDQFRHEMNDDLVIVSTGQKGYVYSSAEKRFQEMDPKTDPRILAILQQQNPSLAMALNKGMDQDFIDSMRDARIGEGVEIEGTTYERIHFSQGPAQAELLIHPVTRLIRRMTIDLKQAMQMQGIPDVKQAQLRYDYSQTDANVELAAETFQWTPPEGAEKIEQPTPQDPNPAASRMIGQPAPQATLKNLDGQEITFGQASEQVVILDFWATWCGPCVPGLKHLNEVAAKAEGVQIYAINLMETAEQVRGFMDRHQLKLNALLDAEGTVAEKYRVEAIPHTVVIGKDGNIVDVVIGFDPNVAPARLDAAIAKAKGQEQ